MITTINNAIFGNRGAITRVFIAIFDTSKTSSGSSANNQITFPVVNNNFNPFIINWGDGSSDTISTWNSSLLTHTYSSSGVKEITVSSRKYFAISFIGSTDRLKILNIKQWGFLYITPGDFSQCNNLDLSSVIDIPVLKDVTSFRSLFQNNTGITNINRFNEWDVKTITTMDIMLANSTNFNQDISGLNFNKDLILTGFMNGKNSSNYNAEYYSNLLIKFASNFIGTGRIANKTLAMGSIKYTSAGSSARAALIADGWIITDGGLI